MIYRQYFPLKINCTIVNIKTDKHVVPGDIELVRIIGASEYDLIGEI